jgi:aminoglycoside phosphotransferase (APT) family kinase protein
VRAKYLGTLDYRDPLYETLLQICPSVRKPLFHVNGTSSGRVYKYTEEKSRVAIIGKFFNLSDRKPERVHRIKGEFDNLQKARSYGFDAFPHYVVRPIGKNEKVGLAVVEEFVVGKNLDYYLKRAIYDGDYSSLKERLSSLASFLYALHTATKTGGSDDLDFVSGYFRKVLDKLQFQNVISDSEGKVYLGLMDRWLEKILIYKVRNAIVHGDATPTNFIFTKDGGVAAIDLERMKNCDMAFDFGMVCGELKHAFLWRTGNAYAAEPFISQFLKKYSGHFRDKKKAFVEITLKNPFYMALTELRIARNSYLEWNYRKGLVHEARKCLKHGLKLQ